MSDSNPDCIQESIAGAAHRVAGGIHNAADQVQHAACNAQSGVSEVRHVIREQPITAALVVFALGYLFGRLGALLPTGHSSTKKTP